MNDDGIGTTMTIVMSATITEIGAGAGIEVVIAVGIVTVN
jgi:preprotein translocase subunit SecY